MASSTPSPSCVPSSSPQDQYDNIIITPSRKVKALLAQFDNSDSDQSSSAKSEKTGNGSGRTSKLEPSNAPVRISSQRVSAAENPASDGEVLPCLPRGRLAARMLPASRNDDSKLPVVDSCAKANRQDEESDANHFTGSEDELSQTSKQKTEVADLAETASSEDDLQRAAPRRLQKKSALHEDLAAHPISRSPSPLFFSSPTATGSAGNRSPRHISQQTLDTEQLLDDTLKRGGSKFLALVEKHRKQRLAREKMDEAKRTERLKQLKKAGSRDSSNTINPSLVPVSDESDMSEPESGRRLTQHARPTRKASKKALEEMNRETQRMSRSMQLAHQARTKKKITKESLLARFNFSAPQPEMGPLADIGHTSPTASSAAASDIEEPREQNTPSTSPLPVQKDKRLGGEALINDEDIGASVDYEEPPDVDKLLTLQSTALDKGKGKAAITGEASQAGNWSVKGPKIPSSRPVRVKWSKEDAIIARGADSDSDLEIVTSSSKFRKFNAFESLPEKRLRETNSHLILRSLAHLQTSIADRKHVHVNNAQMEINLRKAARLQAQKEREEKLEELRAKGISIQTTEERHKEQQEVEDLVEQARVEGAEIHRREKERAKKDGTFVRDQLDDSEGDDEDDADFEDEDDEIEEHLSGSEEEEEIEVKSDLDDGSEGDSKLDHTAGSLEPEVIVREAEEVQSEPGSESAQSGEEDTKEIEMENKLPKKRSSNRRLVLLSDEEDVGDDQQLPSPKIAKTPQSILRSARKVIPGLQMSDDLPIGLTQAFAATMADSGSEDGDIAAEQDSPALSYNPPSPHFNAIPALTRLESLDVVTDSQPITQIQPLGLDLSTTQTPDVPQSPAGLSFTQVSFMPTQDAGYIMSPFKENRFETPLPAPHSTIDTVILPEEEQSPIVQRKRRLRRGRTTTKSDDEGEDSATCPGGLGADRSAFAVMQRVAKSIDQESVYDKSKSHAKDVVDEAAEESEDEYAGLGGVSDDEEGEEDEADQRLIDHDESLGQGDESKLAGFYADKERKQDEVTVSKLLKDLTTGALRRKRGAADEIDLSDEEDASARRREAKRREFARMRRELLKDEAVGKIADDRKKQAFLKSIEDHDEIEYEDVAPEEVEDTEENAQSQPQPAATGINQVETAAAIDPNPRRRPLEPSAADITNRPSSSLRRTSNKAVTVHRKPSTLAEIREHVSFLIEEPDSQSNTPDLTSSDDEAYEPQAYVNLDRHLYDADEENQDGGEGLADFIVDDEERSAFKKPLLPTTRAPATQRRTKPNVIDRLSLLRQSSSSSAISQTVAAGSTAPPGSKPAFFTSASASASASSTLFKTPSLLLRRATTNSSFHSHSSESSTSATGVTTTERGAVEHEKEMIRKAQGGRRSAINFYARGRVEERDAVREGRVGKAKTKAKAGSGKKGKGKARAGFLGGLFGRDSWE